MNVFFVFEDGSLQTPPLGRYDPGRDHAGFADPAGSRRRADVREEPYSIEQWQADARAGG
jgi:branched-chain amino acid aminotransferase